MSERTFVIVGASLAGAKAAEALREKGFDGRVLLIGAEDERPYERPPLTKDYLRGESERDATHVHPAEFYAEHEIELITGAAVSELDPSDSTVRFADGREERFDKLLLSVGAEPRRLDVPGAELDGIYYLRSLADCDALKERMTGGGHVAVVGAGWIGSEFAASARQQGLEATVIDPLRFPNERVFGQEIGSFYRDVHAQHGVNLMLETAVEAFEGDGAVRRVVVDGGRHVDADFVLVAVGVVPRVQLAAAAGLEVGNGVIVDQHLQSSAASVFAAGDVANAWHPFYEQHVRVEHWANALNQGPAAAAAMLEEPAPYERLPYFFSDQYDVGMEYSGFATSWDEVVFRGDRDGGEFVAFWLKDSRVLAGMNVNVWDVNEHVQSLIRSRRAVDADALRDVDTSLEALAGGERDAA